MTTGRPDEPRAPEHHHGAGHHHDDRPLPVLTAAEPALPPDEVSADALALARRLRQPRTLISIALPIVILVLLARTLPGFQLDRLPEKILAADPLLLLLAFLIYYLGFPLRGYRWALLLRGTGTSIGVRDSTEIIFISWLVNCVVPAKLGDVYRAYLLRLNYMVSLSRTFGTVFIERIFDLFAIAILGLASAFWSFRTGLSGPAQFVVVLGLLVLAALSAALYTVRNFGRRLLVRLPLPHKVVELYDRFEEGVFAVGSRQVPRIAVVTVLIWTTEALRLFFVVEALGLEGVQLGISGAFFVALAGSLLTAVPLTPAGIGIVEAGVVGILTTAYGVSATDAATIALVDRAISVLSIIVLGSIAYIVSPKTKGRAGGAGPDAIPASA